MPLFHYQAIDRVGNVTQAAMECASEAVLVRRLQDGGQFPIRVTVRAGASTRWRQLLATVARPSQQELAVATRELATLVEAGLPLDRALQLVGSMGETRRLHPALRSVLGRVRDGATLSEALAPQREFSTFYVNMVRGGEIGGSIEPTLQRLAEYLSKAQALRDALVSAMIYPAVLFVTAICSAVVIVMFVLPEFESFFETAGKPVPSTMRLLIDIGTYASTFWWAILGAMVALTLSLRYWLRRPAMRRRRDAWLLRAPVIGELVLGIEMEKFGRGLGTLLQSGVPLPNALAIASDMASNAAVAASIRETSLSIREGDGLAARLQRTGRFPTIVIDLARIGEETGRMEEMLLRLADIHQRKVRHTLDRILALVSPITTVVMGLVVAALVASMLTAILSMNEAALY